MYVKEERKPSSFIRLTKSRPKAENVVKPPHTPRIQNARKKSGSDKPSIARTKNPIRNAPITFTKTVGQGENDCKSKETDARPMEPIAPPKPTRRRNWKPIT